MTKRFLLPIAIVLLAATQACSSGDSSAPPGTCSPSAHTAPDPEGAAAYCAAFYDVVCERAFSDCAVEIGLDTYFADAAACKATLQSTCTADATDWYDAACGESCLAFGRTAPCSAFDGEEPQACAQATGSLPPACTATISPGTTTSDTISAADPMYDGGHARTYCITFAAGQSVTIETSAPLSGTALGDSVIHLIDPAGVEIASDDDSGYGFYSLLTSTLVTPGEYRIVVRGFVSSVVGSFRLTTTVN